MGGILSSCMKKSGCKCNCDECCNEPDTKYCGDGIDCLDIKKGDYKNDVIKKIGDALCKNAQEIEVLMSNGDIIVEDNPNCENGGFIVRDRNEIDGETSEYKIMYQTCFPCCGGQTECIDEYYSKPPGFIYNKWTYTLDSSGSIGQVYSNVVNVNNSIVIDITYFNFLQKDFVITNFTNGNFNIEDDKLYYIKLGKVVSNTPDLICSYTVQLGDGINSTVKQITSGNDIGFVLRADSGMNYTSNDLIVKASLVGIGGTRKLITIDDISIVGVDCTNDVCANCVPYPINTPNEVENDPNNTWVYTNSGLSYTDNVKFFNDVYIGHDNDCLVDVSKRINTTVGQEFTVDGFRDDKGNNLVSGREYCFEATALMCFNNFEDGGEAGLYLQFGDGASATKIPVGFGDLSSYTIAYPDVYLIHIKKTITVDAGTNYNQNTLVLTVGNTDPGITSSFLSFSLFNFTLDSVDCCCDKNRCDCRDDVIKTVYYKESRSPLLSNSSSPDVDGNTYYSSDIEYTITGLDGAGTYEIFLYIGMINFNTVQGGDVPPYLAYGLHVNNVPALNQGNVISLPDGSITTSSLYYQRTLNVGDNVGIYTSYFNQSIPSTAQYTIQHYTFCVKRIS